ncbi:MAG: MarR family transcriptional regulator [Roseibium sp.]
MDPKSSPIQNYLSYALAAAHRKVSTSLNTRLRKHGIQIEAWRILETLEAGDRLTMGELADVVLMNPPTLTKLVDRLVSDGLVHRQVARSDHRQINVLPTALGRKRMMQIREEIQDQDALLLEQLGDTQSKQLMQLLRGIT